jgi:predicted DNA-binding transcriptional regulator AlpA
MVKNKHKPMPRGRQDSEYCSKLGWILSDKSLVILFNACRTTIWRWTRTDKFPKPVKLGGATRWRLSDIETWEQKQ